MTKRFALLLCVALLQVPTAPVCVAQASHDTFELDGRVALHAYEAMVETHLGGVLNALKALAATQEAASGDWQRLKPPLAAYARVVSSATAVWYARPDGTYFTVEKNLTGGSLKDRPYFAALLNGEAVDGSLIVSKSTGARAVVVAAPIMQGGRVTGALGASLSVARLAAWVNDRVGFPDNVVFYALDSQGRTALHKDTSLIFQFPSDLGDVSLRSAVKEMLSEPQGSVRYTFRGERRTVIFETAKTTGWVFALGITHGGRVTGGGE